MRKAERGVLARRARPVIAVAAIAVIAADLAVAIAAPSRVTTDSSHSVASTSLGSLLQHRFGGLHHAVVTQSGASVVPQVTSMSAHKKKKSDPPTVAGAVLGIVNGLAGSSQPPTSGGSGGHHPKSGSKPRGGGSPPTHANPIGRPAPRADLPFIPSNTMLATLKNGRAPGFSSAHARHHSMMVPRTWYGRTTAMPIVAETATRYKVRLARRPDESTTWVRKRAVTVSSSKYALLVDLSKRRLYLFKAGRQIGSFPVGIGLPQTPTPTGIYFLAFHAPPNGPGYGSVMLETSAHSKVFQTFEGGNDAIIAIHGPIDSAANSKIGKNGARVSNGCIRMHDGQLNKAAKAPDGTPIILHA